MKLFFSLSSLSKPIFKMYRTAKSNKQNEYLNGYTLKEGKKVFRENNNDTYTILYIITKVSSHLQHNVFSPLFPPFQEIKESNKIIIKKNNVLPKTTPRI